MWIGIWLIRPLSLRFSRMTGRCRWGVDTCFDIRSPPSPSRLQLDPLPPSDRRAPMPPPGLRRHNRPPGLRGRTAATVPPDPHTPGTRPPPSPHAGTARKTSRPTKSGAPRPASRVGNARRCSYGKTTPVLRLSYAEPTPRLRPVRITKVKNAGGNVVTKVNTLHRNGLG